VSCTQVDIAKEIGLDVSSVNKILNKRGGAVFHKNTIKRVFVAARRMGYDFDKASKGKLVATLRDLFPKEISNETLAITRGLPIEKVQQIRELIARAGGAAIVIFALTSICGF